VFSGANRFRHSPGWLRGALRTGPDSSGMTIALTPRGGARGSSPRRQDLRGLDLPIDRSSRRPAPRLAPARFRLRQIRTCGRRGHGQLAKASKSPVKAASTAGLAEQPCYALCGLSRHRSEIWWPSSPANADSLPLPAGRHIHHLPGEMHVLLRLWRLRGPGLEERPPLWPCAAWPSLTSPAIPDTGVGRLATLSPAWQAWASVTDECGDTPAGGSPGPRSEGTWPDASLWQLFVDLRRFRRRFSLATNQYGVLRPA